MIGAASAGGAPLDQVAVISVLYGGGTAALLWLVSAHRSGRTRLLARAGAAAALVFRAPAWAALPVALASASLLLVMFGGFWDIGYHIDFGRDDGPLGNPGHYPMLFGFFGTFAAGVLAIALADREDASPSWIRVGRGWRAPVGGVLIAGCSTFGLLALPLDDVWHRIFGQDVTLWSPTHFMLLGGSTLSVIGMLVLVAEGVRARHGRARTDEFSPWAWLGQVWWWVQRVALFGGMLVGLEAFLAEYDWGVPLYRQVWQPLLLAAASGFVLVAARAWAGRGGALGAWGFYVVIRGAATLMPVLAGRSASVFPLFLAAALSVELAAVALSPRARPLAFGALAGLLCGTLGVAGEYAWSQIAMPLPWTPALIGDGLLAAVPAGVAGGVLGALLACGLRGALPPPRVARVACMGAFAVLVAVGVNAGIRNLPQAVAHVELTEVRPEPRREALATIRLEPRDAAADANWLYVLAWQGGAGSKRMVDRLEEVREGVYRSTRPIPLHGTWKVGLRYQRGRARGAVPVRLPADEGIGSDGAQLPASFTDVDAATEVLRSEAAGSELPAPGSFSRVFLDDTLIVLRETKGDVPGWVWALGIGLIAVLYMLFIAAVAAGVARITRRREAAVSASSSGSSDARAAA